MKKRIVLGFLGGGGGGGVVLILALYFKPGPNVVV
jgi:hypothetical protein